MLRRACGSRAAASPCPTSTGTPTGTTHHAGDFFSRHGIGPGALTLHPQGIHHGPHPKAFEAARGKTGTDEVAVLVETTAPLRVAPEAEKVEVASYATSWADGLREMPRPPGPGA